MLALNFMLTRHSKNFITNNVLHRWKVFNGVKYMNCQEKIQNCNSIVFEDYNIDKKLIINKTVDSTNKIKEDINEDEDPGIIALTYYHF